MVNTGRIWVTGTASLIAFIAYSPQLTGLITGAPLWQLVTFNLLVGLIFFNYVRVVRTDPGSPLEGWQPHEPSFELRFCKKCEAPKPPRAHHCRHCKRCILRFDHHCPWVNNCVGHFNYPYFLRFLLYVDLACAMHLYLLTYQAFDEAKLMRDPTGTEIAFLVANYVCCIPVMVSVGLFSIYHFWNLSTNTSTIEGSEIDRVRKMVKRGKIKATPFPFNVGWLTNVTSVLGHTPVEWLFGGKPSGDGLSYPFTAGSDPMHWPPRDPYDSLRESWNREAEVQKSRYPPYHPAYSALEADDDDDVPLSDIQTRSVRIRRGSEGFEVGPRDSGSDSEDEGLQGEQQDSDWEELYEKRMALYDSGSDDD